MSPIDYGGFYVNFLGSSGTLKFYEYIDWLASWTRLAECSCPLDGIFPFCVNFQSLHYANMAVRPQRDSSGEFSILREDKLPHIINPVEAYLGKLYSR